MSRLRDAARRTHVAIAPGGPSNPTLKPPHRLPTHSVTARGAMASMSLTQSMTMGRFALNA